MINKTIALGGLLAISANLCADTSSHLENIIVSANRTERPAQIMPMNISVITAEDIEHSGAMHLIEILRGLGGLDISDLYGDGTDAIVGLRGFSATAQQNTLILVDGRRLNNADNGPPDLNSVAPADIDRIEIVRGSMGTLYGDKAVGGVINIITRTPEEFYMVVSADYGSYHKRNIGVQIENAHSNGINYRFGGERRLSDNYRDENTLQLGNISSRIGLDHSRGRLFLEFQDIDEDIQVPGPLFTDLVKADREQALNRGDYIDTDTRVARAGFKQDINSATALLAEFTWRESSTDGRLSSGGVPSRFRSARRHREFTPRLAGELGIATGDILYTAGIDLFETDYRISSDFGITDDTQSQASLYVQATLPLSPHLAATIGARHGKVMNDILVDTIAFGRSLPDGTEIDDSANAWEAGLSFIPDPSLRLFARIATNYRFVTADEYSAVADNNFFANLFAFGAIVPLPQTQQGKSVELGMEWFGEEITAVLQLYQVDLKDEIVFDPSLFLNTNAGDTRRRGVIADISYAPANNLEIDFSYSFIDAQVTSGAYRDKALTFLSDHIASLRARYQFNDHVNGFFEVTGVSKRVLGGDFSNRFSRLPGHALANMALNWQHGGIKLSFRINNLLDKEYSDAANTGFDFRQPFPSPQVATFFPAPGRNFLLSVQYSYR